MSTHRIAVVPGSFDPVTLGHVDLIQKAARLFDTVWVVAMINAEKAYWFTPGQRVDMLREAVSHLDNVRVEYDDGMLWRYALDKGACAIVKGIRTGQDAAYELEMARFNSARNPLAETLLLPASPGMEDISSTRVRQLAREDISRLTNLVTLYTLEQIKRK